MAFVANLQRLARCAYSDFPAAEQEKLTLHTYLRGLRPTRLRKHVQLATPCSLPATLEAAEAVLRDSYTSSGFRHVRRGTCVALKRTARAVKALIKLRVAWGDKPKG